jgi:3-oxoacyl-[acyl-carrier-protein] synthase-3
VNPGIRAIRSYLPETVIGNDDAVAAHGFDEAFIREKLGIRQRHVAGPEEYVSDLASGAVRRLLDDTGIDPNSVGLLVVVTQTPDYCLPHVSAMVQHRCNLPTTLAAFDVSLGCSGYVYGLSIALATMAANDIGTGILVTADVYSKLIAPTDRNTAALFGDGATATLLGRDAIYLPGRFAFGTDGSRHEALIARGSAVRRDREEPLFMDGGEIFGFVMGNLPSHVTGSLKINNVEKDEIDAWVFHQASRHMLQTLAPRLGLSPADMRIDLEDVGNTTSSSIPIVLERRIVPAVPRPTRVFLCGFGVGLSWASTVLTAT